MKKIIRYLCLIVCCLPSGGFAQNAPQSIAGKVVSLSTTATVPVYALDFINISSCDLKFSYDSTIAIATGVAIGPGMGGMISTNLSTPGEVNFGWFTSGGINLPDSSVIFNLQFAKTGNGISSIQWIDNGHSCEYNDGNSLPLNDSPASDYYQDGSLVFQSPDAPVTSAPVLSALAGTEISIPISVSGFHLIGSFSLNLQFDPEVLTFNTFTNDAVFPGMEIDGSQPGNILVSGLVPEGDTAVTLVDNSILFTLNFDYLGGSTGLNWIDNGPSCQYSGSVPVYPILNDSPQNTYYLNGLVSENLLPSDPGAIAGPSQVCLENPMGTYSIEEISNASGYVWSAPEGAMIVSGQNTNMILVDFESGILSGIISVYGTNSFGIGNPSTKEVSVIDQPASAGLITGTWEVCLGQSQVFYSVDPVVFATSYNWLLPEGAVITSGMNTNTIQVQYGDNSASGYVSVSGINSCGTGGASSPQWVMVNNPTEILMEPVSPPAVTAGEGTAIFSLLASGTNLTYHWQEYAGTWNNLTESDLYMGVSTDTLRIINPTISMNDNHYRCLVSGECDPTVITNGDAVLTVLTPVGIKENNEKPIVSSYSNPFSDFITLNLNFPAKGTLTIKLVNILGQPVNQKTEYSGNSGMQTIRINTPALKPGIYLLQLNLKTDHNLMTTTLKLVCSHESK
ncbi:MAG: T9SS type A sorting domain-containing protein [Bacteroidales bacterium]|nr:T9SS type A sorting domain-containing protein [Bacteroidales bacterium]